MMDKMFLIGIISILLIIPTTLSDDILESSVKYNGMEIVGDNEISIEKENDKDILKIKTYFYDDVIETGYYIIKYRLTSLSNEYDLDELIIIDSCEINYEAMNEVIDFKKLNALVEKELGYKLNIIDTRGNNICT